MKLLLLTISTSLVAILLITNSAIAFTSLDNSPTKIERSTFSLNIIGPSLQLVSSNTLLDHAGCSCLSCSQGVRSTTI